MFATATQRSPHTAGTLSWLKMGYNMDNLAIIIRTGSSRAQIWVKRLLPHLMPGWGSHNSIGQSLIPFRHTRLLLTLLFFVPSTILVPGQCRWLEFDDWLHLYSCCSKETDSSSLSHSEWTTLLCFPASPPPNLPHPLFIQPWKHMTWKAGCTDHECTKTGDTRCVPCLVHVDESESYLMWVKIHRYDNTVFTECLVQNKITVLMWFAKLCF